MNKDHSSYSASGSDSAQGQAGNESRALARHFKYLDALRESGITNMFGARPYLQQARRLNKEKSTKVLSAWMKTFSVSSDAQVRANEAIKLGLVSLATIRKPNVQATEE